MFLWLSLRSDAGIWMDGKFGCFVYYIRSVKTDVARCPQEDECNISHVVGQKYALNQWVG